MPTDLPRATPPGRRALALASLLLLSACAPELGPNTRGPRAEAPSAPPVSAGVSRAARGAPGQRQDRLALIVHDGEHEAFLADHGLRALSEPGASGFFVVAVEDGQDPQALLAELFTDPRVRCALQESWAEGGGGALTAPVTDPLRWHLDAAGAPRATGGEGVGESVGESEGDGARVVVAVIDSGLMGQGDGGALWSAGSLGGSRIESPWDFVNDDPWPQDDQRHGSHMASIIAAAGAAEGAAGVAPGVSIMPLKVLNEDNLGSEIDIINAIFWAVDHGADIINLSLSFWPDYVPTEGMQNALGYADRNGVIVVGASGNHGHGGVSWPAASPLVLAVGATCMDGRGGLALAPYSNHGLGVDLVAPGGCLDRDVDGDGVWDGIVGEVPALGAADARATELVLWGGTSQAAAVVSGALARLMQQGATGPEAAAALRLGLSPLIAGGSAAAHRSAGLGGGGLNLGEAGALIGHERGDGVLAAVLPWLEADAAGGLRPRARISALDRGTGMPLAGAQLWVELVDTEGGRQTLTCATDARGQCDLGPEAYEAAGEQSWTFEVALAIPRGGEAHQPGNVIFAHEGLGLLERALAAEGAEGEASPWLEGEPLLGLSWPAGVDPVLGPVAEAWSFIDLTAGWARLPRAVVATRAAVEGLGEITEVQLPLSGDRRDGTLEVERLVVEGSGLSTSPIGLVSLPVVALRVSSALSSGLQMHPTDAHSAGGSGLSTSPIGYAPIDLGRRSTLGGGALDPAIEGRYLGPGWRTLSGQGAGDVMPVIGLREEAPLRVEGTSATEQARYQP